MNHKEVNMIPAISLTLMEATHTGVAVAASLATLALCAVLAYRYNKEAR